MYKYIIYTNTNIYKKQSTMKTSHQIVIDNAYWINNTLFYGDIFHW